MLAFLPMGAVSDLQNYKCVNWYVCKYTFGHFKEIYVFRMYTCSRKKKEEKISYECLGVVFVVLLFASREQGDWVAAHP